MFVPVVVGVILLGKAFDLYHVTPTDHQIIDQSAIEKNLQIIPQTCSEKHYKIVKTAADVNAALKLDPFISLKVKNGDARTVGLESYLSTVINRNRTLEILMVVDLETETRSYPPRLAKGSGWQEKPQEEVGTHYVSSIKYGGLLVASLRFTATKPKYFDQIEKDVLSKIPRSGSLDELFFKNLESVVRSVSHKASMIITVVSTAGTFSPPTNIQDLAKLVKQYPEIVSQVNGGKGLPLRIELEDLHKVQSNYTRFEINQELEALVEEVNEKVEDLRVARKLLRDWKITNPIMTEDEEKIIEAYEAKLSDSIKAFSSAITKLHYDGETNQLSKAFNAYYRLNINVPYRYTSYLETLIKANNDKSFFQRFFTWFIRWAKSVVGL